MPKSFRSPVSKGKSAGSFKRNVSRTKKMNFVVPMRGGRRL